METYLQMTEPYVIKWDTRQLQDHAEWCNYLANRGSLSPDHRLCRHTTFCVASGNHKKKVEAND